jgi:SAM-dependent methyltransferase
VARLASGIPRIGGHLAIPFPRRPAASYAARPLPRLSRPPREPMTPTRDLLERIERLRTMFLAERPPGAPLPDYWRDDRDLQAYDAVLGARIGWKWDAALAECQDRGLPRADDAVVLDYGCGAGIAARKFAAKFGAKEVLCHDRSARAREYASRAIRIAMPAVAARAVATVYDQRPDVLLVSHVLGELDAAGLQQLELLALRSRCVFVVEPGNQPVSRALSMLRDRLLPQFDAIAPCPHQAACPALRGTRDWCHFFAAPPPQAFTDGDWVRTTKALGIDARALPYSFLCLVQKDAAPRPAAPRLPRLLGRPTLHPHTAVVQVCEADGLHDVELQKRRDPALWKALKKEPETVRDLP